MALNNTEVVEVDGGEIVAGARGLFYMGGRLSEILEQLSEWTSCVFRRHSPPNSFAVQPP